MATSKLTTADAQEWLDSLKLVGEGWYRQVQLAVKANAHKSLGMDRREFARSIGQKMIDPTEAIIEMYQAGSTPAEISDILGVDRARTVVATLKDAGIYREPKQLQGAAAASVVAKQAKSATTRGAGSPRLQQAKQNKAEELAKISPAEKKEAEAQFEEFVQNFKSGLNQAAGVYLKLFAQELRQEVQRVMDNDLVVEDYDEVMQLWADTGRELWVYGAKRGYDVSIVRQLLNWMEGGD